MADTATNQESPTVDGITAEEVLGMMSRLQQRNRHPPALLVMSVEARAEIRALGEQQVQRYREMEAMLKERREAGNQRAFFIECPR